MSDIIFILVVLGAINHQVTHILTVGVVFADFREWMSRTFGADSKMAYLTRCHLCAGTWIGFLIAAVTNDAVRLVSDPLVNFAPLSFAVALVGRVWNEGLALASSGVSLIRARVEQPQTPAVPPVQPADTARSQQTCTPCERPFDDDSELDHLMLWTNVPRDMAPAVGDAITQRGISYEVIHLQETPSGVDVLCEPYYFGEFHPSRLIVVDERTAVM